MPVVDCSTAIFFNMGKAALPGNESACVARRSYPAELRGPGKYIKRPSISIALARIIRTALIIQVLRIKASQATAAQHRWWAGCPAGEWIETLGIFIVIKRACSHHAFGAP